MRGWRKGDRHVREEGELVTLSHADIPEAYQAARTPLPAAEAVAPLKYSPGEIRALLARLGPAPGADG